jgi:hypothetical protein
MPAGFTTPIVVNRVRCDQVAQVLTRLGVPEDGEEVEAPSLPASHLGNFYLSLVAICHQTQSLTGSIEGRARRGWDYLQGRWREATSREQALLTSSGWATLTSEGLEQLFEDPLAGRTLSAVNGRTQLLNDLGNVMLQERWRDLEDLYRLADWRIATGSLNLLSLLGRFRAYNDPVRKKSLFLLGLMRNSAGWEFADPSELGPPVDYHEVRGHLRLGTVEVLDPALREKLIRRRPVEQSEDVALRAAVSEAIRLVAERAGIPSPIRFHYLFWNVFRSVCLREGPHCLSYPSNGTLPSTYAHLVGSGDTKRCPFSEICLSTGASDLYLEHAFDTDWY